MTHISVLFAFVTVLKKVIKMIEIAKVVWLFNLFSPGTVLFFVLLIVSNLSIRTLDVHTKLLIQLITYREQSGLF